MKSLLVAFSEKEVSACVSFGQALAQPYDLLLLKGEPQRVAGPERILSANLIAIPPADAVADGISTLASQYTHIVATSSMQSKDVLARLAGLMDAAMVTDAIEAISPTEYKRPIIAGSIIATVEVLSTPVVITFRPASFKLVATGTLAQIERVDVTASSRVERVSVSAREGTRPDLSQAKVVVSGGRPLRDAETFEKIIGGLADVLGGAAGATRAAVDSGIAPNELQVGQTGKIVAPDLYIAAGISGSTQHMAGIKDSKVIVAINKDPDAPIFDTADLGIVGDLYEVIPALQAGLRKT